MEESWLYECSCTILIYTSIHTHTKAHLRDFLVFVRQIEAEVSYHQNTSRRQKEVPVLRDWEDAVLEGRLVKCILEVRDLLGRLASQAVVSTYGPYC